MSNLDTTNLGRALLACQRVEQLFDVLASEQHLFAVVDHDARNTR